MCMTTVTGLLFVDRIYVKTFEVKGVVLNLEDDEDVIFDRDERTILVLVLGPGLAPGLGLL